MRKFSIHGLALLALALVTASAGHAENRTFIIPSNADGYGTDRCLATGDRCGMTIATAYCQSQDYAQAKSFRKLDRDEITGAVPTSTRNVCSGAGCESFVAIVCSR